MTGDENKKDPPTETTAQPQHDAPHVPEILNAEAILAAAGGFPITGHKIDRYRLEWRKRQNIDRYEVKWRKNNSDIGQGPGRRSAKAFVCQRAEEELKAGYSGTKWALAEMLSDEVATKYADDWYQLTMCADNVHWRITAVWQKYRGK